MLDDDVVARIYVDTWPGAPPFLERECTTAEEARELERHWLTELRIQQVYWRGKREGASEQSRKTFASQVRSRRDRLALILTDASQEWPPPVKLAPWAYWGFRDFPSRELTHQILDLWIRLQAESKPHGCHKIAELLKCSHPEVTWQRAQWAIDVFGDVIA